MFHFIRYPYDNYKPVKYVVNPVRCVEAFLCVVCLIVAITMVVSLYYMSTAVKIVIIVVSASFTIITIYDIISNSSMTPIYWHTWVLFATTGAIFFFLCTGVLIATYTGVTVLLLIGEILNAVTAIVFLLDALLILHALRKRQVEVWPEDVEDATQTEGEMIQTKLLAPPQNETDDMYEWQLEEPDSGEITTIEKHIETKRSISNRRTTVREIEDEHIIEHIETPSRQRSTTSYGGTFPVAKDAAPLPSPEQTYVESPKVNRRRSSVSKPSTSVTIVKTPTGRLHRGADGKMYLVDGTPLTQIRLQNGELGYRDPNGVLYTKDGTPIVQEEGLKTQLIRETSRHRMTTQGLVFRRGEWYTINGQPVPRVKVGGDGNLFTEDGCPLYKIETGTGNVLYKSPDNFLYTSEGLPVGYSADVEEETTRTYDSGVVMRSTEAQKLGACGDKQIETNIVPVGSRVETSPSLSGPFEIIRSREFIRTVEPIVEYPSSVTIPKGSHRMYLQDGTPLTETNTTSGTLMYKGPDGELFTQEGYPVYPSNEDVKLRHAPCMPCQKSETPPRIVSRPIKAEAKNSRTVAISTRMVPKKSHSAPPSPEPKETTPRPVKSAGPPQVVYQQHVQKPCVCGNVHYQTVSTVHGTMCMCSLSAQKPEATEKKHPQQYPSYTQKPEVATEKKHLQPISEDHETDASHPGTFDHTSSSSCDKCYVCGDRNCRIHQKRSQGTDSAQTSETRMIRACDVQRMNINLPGSSDQQRK